MERIERSRWRCHAVAAALVALVAAVGGTGIAGSGIDAVAAQAPSTSSTTATSTASTAATGTPSSGRATSSTSEAGAAATSGAGEGTSAPASASTTGPTTPPDPPGTPFPAPLVAAVHPAVPDGPRPIQVEGFYVTPGLADEVPQVAITFAQLFELPDQRWRVSVLAGQPGGERLRVSLVSDGESTSGTAQLADGDGWVGVGTPEVTFDPSGLVLVPLDRSLVPDGDGTPPLVWVEAVLGVEGSGDEQRSTTPWYDLGSVVGSGAAGVLVGGRLAPVGDPADGAVTVADLGASPLVSLAREPAGGDLVRSTVLLTYDGPPPSEVAGQPVAEVVDLLRVAPDFVGGAVVTPYVEVNRTTGAVRLVDARQWPLVDASGDGSWQRADATTGSPTGAGTLAFDLDAVLAALGDQVDRSTAAVGLTRTVRLADGTQVVAEGVLGSTAWLDTAVGVTVPTAALPLAAPAPTDLDADPDGGGVPPAGIATVVVLAVAGLGLLESGRRRRAAARADAEAAAGSVPTGPPTDEQPVVAPDGSSTATDEPRWGAATAVAEAVAAAGTPSAWPDEAPNAAPAEAPVTSSDEAAPSGPAAGVVPTPVVEPEAPADDVPWWRSAPAEPARPRHRAEGVVIDAELVTDLVPEVAPAAEVAPPPSAAAPPSTDPSVPPGGPAGGSPGAGEPPPPSADPSSSPTPPAPTPDDQPAPGPRVVDADVDALAERLRRLGGG